MHNSEYWQGVGVWLCIVVSVIGILSYIGRAFVYSDRHDDQLMQSCQANGYTWGKCYNVIHGSEHAFDK